MYARDRIQRGDIRLRPGRWATAAFAAVSALYACTDQRSGVITGPVAPQVQAARAADPGFTEPLTLRSSAGRLEVTLTAAPALVNIGGQMVWTPVFNGTYLAPTLRVRRGDVLRVTLVNGSGMETNLHTHGLEVPPTGMADNIFRVAPSGGSLTYEYVIPADHPAGTFWYHPHVHGNASAQTKFGLAGVLIVEGLQEEVPALRGLPERVLVLRDAQIAGTVIDTALEIGIATTRTVNGVDRPTLTIAPGETQLWRVSNQSANLYYRLTLDGHLLYQVGRDGNRLNRVLPLEEVFIAPGGRADLVVQARAGDTGEFLLRTRPVETGADGDSYDGAVLATLRVRGKRVPELPIASITMAPLADLRAVVTNSRAIVFGQARDGLEFMVNGQYFDMNQINTRVRLGNVERWTIRNVTREWHVFHIHQVQFQVVEVDGRPVPFDGYRDVVNVKDGSSVTVVIPFDDPRTAGKYVYHCHILDHEDRGMMAVIQVGPGEPSSLMGSTAAMGQHGTH